MYNPSVHFDKRMLEFTSTVFLSTYKRVDWNEFIENELSLTDDISKDICRYLRVELVSSNLVKVDPKSDSLPMSNSEYTNLTRYSIVISPTTVGHLLVIGDDYLYDIPQGGIFKWVSPEEQYRFKNTSDKPCYLINLITR